MTYGAKRYPGGLSPRRILRQTAPEHAFSSQISTIPPGRGNVSSAEFKPPFMSGRDFSATSGPASGAVALRSFLPPDFAS